MVKRGRKKQVQRPKRVKNLRKVDSTFGLKYWKIFDIPLFGGDKSRVLNLIESNLRLGKKKYWIATVNPEFVMAAEKDREFKQMLKVKTSLNVIDGIGLVWANELNTRDKISEIKWLRKIERFLIGFWLGGKVLRGKYKHQIASGADLILDLAKMAKKMNKKIFLLGGWEDRAAITGQYLKQEFGLRESQIMTCAGEPTISNEKVIEKINRFKPEILLVAYGMKRQEIWIGKNLEKMEVGMVMGVGRSFDYYSGSLKRAPKVCRRMGMEWLYSLVKEPQRLKRQVVLPKFVWRIICK